ncbi:MAG: biotin/lipoyl-containing protein [bacterium]
MQHSFKIKVGAKVYDIAITEKPRAHVEVKVNDHRFEFPPRSLRDAVKKVMGKYPLDKSNPKVVAVKSSLPGVIGVVAVEVGSSVEKGDRLCVLLSMKMENEVVAPVAGKVREVLVRQQGQVNKGDVLFVLES